MIQCTNPNESFFVDEFIQYLEYAIVQELDRNDKSTYKDMVDLLNDKKYGKITRMIFY